MSLACWPSLFRVWQQYHLRSYFSIDLINFLLLKAFFCWISFAAIRFQCDGNLFILKVTTSFVSKANEINNMFSYWKSTRFRNIVHLKAGPKFFLSNFHKLRIECTASNFAIYVSNNVRIDFNRCVFFFCLYPRHKVNFSHPKVLRL